MPLQTKNQAPNRQRREAAPTKKEKKNQKKQKTKNKQRARFLQSSTGPLQPLRAHNAWLLISLVRSKLRVF
jgi:hypothetical protein